jgi:hypothetical protein
MCIYFFFALRTVLIDTVFIDIYAYARVRMYVHGILHQLESLLTTVKRNIDNIAEGKRRFERRSIDGRTILKCILTKYDTRVRTEL